MAFEVIAPPPLAGPVHNFLRGVVRVSRTSRTGLQIRIANDLIDQAGIPAAGPVTVAQGRGRDAGLLRIEPARHGVAHFVLHCGDGHKASTLNVSGLVVPALLPRGFQTAGHRVQPGLIDVDLTVWLSASPPSSNDNEPGAFEPDYAIIG